MEPQRSHESPALPMLAAHELRVIAVESNTDPRSVKKVLAGQVVRTMAHSRIVSALHRLGLGHLVGVAR